MSDYDYFMAMMGEAGPLAVEASITTDAGTVTIDALTEYPEYLDDLVDDLATARQLRLALVVQAADVPADLAEGDAVAFDDRAFKVIEPPITPLTADRAMVRINCLEIPAQ